MIRLLLERFAYAPWGTYGTLELPDGGRVFTVECAWLDNIRFHSCIPQGSYLCTRYNSPTYGETFIVNNVPNRFAILFHVGNAPPDLQGCIALVKGSPMIHKGVWGISKSRDAMNQFFKELEGIDEFELVIKQKIV